MSGARSLDRGKRAEREVCNILHNLLGVDARRHQAGHSDDIGDILNVPDCTIQVADWRDVVRAVRQKPLDVEQQRNGAAFVATWIRLWGGDFRVVLTPDQWAEMYRETT